MQRGVLMQRLPGHPLVVPGQRLDASDARSCIGQDEGRVGRMARLARSIAHCSHVDGDGAGCLRAVRRRIEA
jgi:hypothetical protein